MVFSTDSRTVQHQDSEDGSGGNCKFQIYSPLLILSVGLQGKHASELFDEQISQEACTVVNPSGGHS